MEIERAPAAGCQKPLLQVNMVVAAKEVMTRVGGLYESVVALL